MKIKACFVLLTKYYYNKQRCGGGGGGRGSTSNITTEAITAPSVLASQNIESKNVI